MPTDPAPPPALVEPAPVVSVDEPVGARERARVRWAAMFGFLGCAVIVIAWFLPWIHVPAEKRQALRAAFEPRIKDLKRDAETAPIADKFEVFLEAAIDRGSLTGLDLFHFLRSAWSLNRWYAGVDARESSARAWLVQRSLLVGAIVFAALPAVALLMTFYFLTHGFRRAASPMLILMTLVGCGAGTMTIAWIRFADLKSLPLPTGIGLQATAAAAVVLGLAGIFGVTARNWWRVYAGAAATLGALAVLAWSYVTGGAMP